MKPHMLPQFLSPSLFGLVTWLDLKTVKCIYTYVCMCLIQIASCETSYLVAHLTPLSAKAIYPAFRSHPSGPHPSNKQEM